MKNLTLPYLQGALDALYYSQTELLGGEIDSEKEFVFYLTPYTMGFIAQLTYVSKYKESMFENDLHTPVYDTQKIYILEDDSIVKVAKSFITEMETIYNAPAPEVVEFRNIAAKRSRFFHI